MTNQGVCSHKPGHNYPHEFDANAEVYYTPSGQPAKIQSLAQTLAELPACKAVCGFKEFAASQEQKRVQTEFVPDGQARGLVPNEAGSSLAKAIQTAAGLKQTTVLCRMQMKKCTKSKVQTLMPYGVAVVLNKENVLPGKREIVFE